MSFARMQSLTAAIHVLPVHARCDCWIASRNDARDDDLRRHLFPDPEITPRATSRFQMNSTTSAPMVAVMKPAPWSGP